MRIALAGPGYPPVLGGVEKVLAQSARALVRAGHTVEVFVQDPRPGAPRLEHDGPIPVHRFASLGPHDYPVAPGLWRALAARSGEFDIVHGHSYHTLSGLAAAACSRAPFVFSPHYHGTGHSPLRAALHLLYRPVGAWVVGRATAVVCVSGAEAGLVAEHFPSAAVKCLIVPNGVDHEPIRAALPFPDAPLTVLSVGRLERYKRVDRLIEAFAQLVPAGPVDAPAQGVQLVVIGDGPDRTRLTALAGRLGLLQPHAPHVAFLGRVDDEQLYRWLRTCRVLCSFSEHEAFGLAPAEALTAGARVILSDIAAHRELAASGPVQLVHSGEDARALALRLRRTLDTAPAPGATTSVADWDEVARRLEEVYAGVLAARARAGARR